MTTNWGSSKSPPNSETGSTFTGPNRLGPQTYDVHDCTSKNLINSVRPVAFSTFMDSDIPVTFCRYGRSVLADFFK